MSMLESLGIQAGGALINRLLGPSFEASEQPHTDIRATAKELHSLQMSDMDPNLRASLSKMNENALSMTRGEIPAGVLDTMRRQLAQRANMSGISADSLNRMNAQSVGQTSLAIMERGAALTASLEGIRQNNWAVAENSALAIANQQYEAYVISENAHLAAFKKDADQFGSLLSGLVSTGVEAVKTKDNREYKRTERDKQAHKQKTQ